MSLSITVTQLSGFDRNKPKTFESASVTIGTDAGSDVKFDPTWDKTVGGHHATVIWEGGGCWLVDANSRDGTLIGGERVQRRKLVPGTVVELGKGGPKIKIDFAGAPAAAVPPATPAPRPGAVDPATTRPVATTPSPAATPPPASSNSALTVVSIALALVLAGGVAWWFFLRGGGDPAEQLAQVAKDKQSAVGVVAVPNPANPEAGLQGNGTAWAIAPRVYVANAAIVWLTSELMGQGVDTFIVVKGEDGPLQLRVTGTRLHPQREDGPLAPLGGTSIVAPYDLGLLLVESDAPDWFEIAPEAEILAISADMPIGFMAHTRRVSLSDPRPRSGSGKVIAMTNFEGAAVDAAETYLI